MGKAKLNIPMLAALILLLLTMVTTHFTSGLYARYFSDGFGTDTAKVASFDVTCEVENLGNDIYSLTVINQSEVAVEYSIVVAMDAHLSATIGEEEKTITGSDTAVTFENTSWILDPGAQADPLTLELKVVDWSGLTDPAVDEGAYKEVNLAFSVSIAAVQIN